MTGNRWAGKTCIIVAMIVLLGAHVFCSTGNAAEFTVILKDFEGEVEVKQAGKDWAGARLGMELTAGDFVATSFASSAMLALPDGSTVQLEEITQIKMENLYTEEGAIRTNIRLRTGGLNANINRFPKVESDFKVTTPASTISVRGTEEAITTLDGFGTEVKVITGSVNVVNTTGQDITIKKGDTSVVEGPGAVPTSPAAHRLEESTISAADVGHTEEEREESQTNLEPAPGTSEEEATSTPGSKDSAESTLMLEYEF